MAWDCQRYKDGTPRVFAAESHGASDADLLRTSTEYARRGPEIGGELGADLLATAACIGEELAWRAEERRRGLR